MEARSEEDRAAPPLGMGRLPLAARHAALLLLGQPCLTMLAEAGRLPDPPLLRFLRKRRLRLRGQLLPVWEVTEQMLHRLPNLVLLARGDQSRACGKETGTLKLLESRGY